MPTVPDLGQVSPTLFSDAENQKKLAANALTSLGLHPDQLGAKSLLDAHFAGPTAHPEVSKIVQPLVDTQGNPVREEAAKAAVAPATPSVPNLTPAGVEGTSNPEPITSIEPPKQETQKPVQTATATAPTMPAPPSTAGTSSPVTPALNIPSPDNRLDLIHANTENSTIHGQNELKRLIDTGSGISQIHNPWLRGFAHAGEIAGDIFAPTLMKDIPGTEAHHAQLINNQERLVNAGIKQGQEEVNTKKAGEVSPEYAEWKKEPGNENKTIEDFWKDKNKALLATRNPAQQEFAFLTAPKEEGGAGLTAQEAFEQQEREKASAKPTAASLKSDFEGLVSKMSAGQPLDPALTNDMPKLVTAIGTSDNLSDEEKQKMFAYLVSNNTPASSAYAPQERYKAMQNLRLTPSIDTTNNHVGFVTPEMNAKFPGRYIPATQGMQIESKEQIFADMHFNADQLKDAIGNLQNGFDAKSRAQFAMVLRSQDPRSAWQDFLGSAAASTLSDDQIDYMTALASLMENAMSLRSVQNMGQGSEELRAAIMKALPGRGTPSKEYALRQLELFNGTLQRIEAGIPKSGVEKPAYTAPKKTEEIRKEEQNKTPAAGGGTTDENTMKQELDRVNKARAAKQLQPYTMDDLKKFMEKNQVKQQ